MVTVKIMKKSELSQGSVQSKKRRNRILGIERRKGKRKGDRGMGSMSQQRNFTGTESGLKRGRY